MKKFILSAMAAGALVVGGVAHADVIDSVGRAISSITGIPYDARPEVPVPLANSVYIDAYGRPIALNQYRSYRDQWGRTVYIDADSRPLYVEENGRVIAYSTVPAPYPYDRYPYDSRYQ